MLKNTIVFMILALSISNLRSNTEIINNDESIFIDKLKEGLINELKYGFTEFYKAMDLKVELINGEIKSTEKNSLIDLENLNLQSGIYFINVYSNSKLEISDKFIIMR